MLFEVPVCGLPAGARSRLSSLGTCAAAPAAVVCVDASPNPSAASPPSAEAGVAGEAGAGPDVASWANARMIDSGSQFAVGCSAPTSASRPSAVGRWPGSLARQRSISGRTSDGTRSGPGEPWTTRYSSAAVAPVPNGPSPVAAKASTAPQAEDVARRPDFETGGLLGGHEPGRAQPQARLRQRGGFHRPEMPKSMTRGPSSASSTFDGLRSRCTTPAAWIALRLSARPAASVSSAPVGSGPCAFIASCNDGPGT